MTATSLADLTWLLPPPKGFAGLCRDVATQDAPGSRLRALAMYALNINQLNHLARAMAAVRDAGGTVEPLQTLRLGLLTSGTAALLAPAICATALRHGFLLDVTTAEYAEVAQAAFDPASAFNRARPDIVLISLDASVLWPVVRPGDEAATAAAVAQALDQVDAMRQAVRAASDAVCIVETVPPPVDPLFGSLDAQVAGAPRNLVDAFNRGLAARLAGSGDVVLDVAALAQQVGLELWHDPVQWYLAKLPFAQAMVPLYADHVGRTLAAMRGLSRRCLVLDLDNTLWGGVIGDDGVDGIVLGQGDAMGEAFLAVQRVAQQLRSRGVVLAVCSKNFDDTARQPFREHPDMLLSEGDIAVFQANWEDKASNLKAIADSLSLGLQSLVLLDDNPAERAQVRAALPEVAVPELPEDPALYPRTLLAAGYFEATGFSDEDVQRAALYRDNAERVALRERVGDLDGYLKSLDMRLVFGSFDAIAMPRVVQLIGKSNQFNLTTRRYNQAEAEKLEADPAALTLQGRLVDRFGDNGIITIVVCRPAGDAWEVDLWLMSCRVLGRRVEEAVLAEVAQRAAAAGATRLIGRYLPTARNELVREHYAKLGFRQLDAEPSGTTIWELDLRGYRPADLPIICEGGETAGQPAQAAGSGS